MKDIILRIENLNTRIGGAPLHQGLNLDLKRGEILGVIGGSGSGKSVLLRVILGLMPHVSGKIDFFFEHKLGKLEDFRSHLGVMFQSGALYSQLTIGENIQLPLREMADVSDALSRELAFLKLAMVGLPEETFYKFPNELSGGMIKRAALARALALDAPLLFLDEPTAGLDPISAQGFDNLLKELHRSLGLSVLMITHDLDTLHTLCNRIAVLVNQHVIVGTLKEMHAHPHPWIQSYFEGDRGRAVRK